MIVLDTHIFISEYHHSSLQESSDPWRSSSFQPSGMESIM